MKTNRFITILLKHGEFVSVCLSGQDHVDYLRKTFPGGSAFEVVAIPLATVLAAPKLLAALKKARVWIRDEFGCASGQRSDLVDLCASAISEATDGGSIPVATPQKVSGGDAPQTSPFTVCAYKPEGERFPVIALRTKKGSYITAVIRRTDGCYQSVRESAGGDQNIKWLYNQTPLPLD